MPFRTVALAAVAIASLLVAGIVTTTRASGASNEPGRVLSSHARPGGGYEIR